MRTFIGINGGGSIQKQDRLFYVLDLATVIPSFKLQVARSDAYLTMQIINLSPK
jgi:hypothetical protein